MDVIQDRAINGAARGPGPGFRFHVKMELFRCIAWFRGVFIYIKGVHSECAVGPNS